MTNRFAKETGKAWGIGYREVIELADWVEDKVPPGYQSKVFTDLLRRRRHQDSNKTKKTRHTNLHV